MEEVQRQGLIKNNAKTKLTGIDGLEDYMSRMTSGGNSPTAAGGFGSPAGLHTSGKLPTLRQGIATGFTSPRKSNRKRSAEMQSFINESDIITHDYPESEFPNQEMENQGGGTSPTRRHINFKEKMQQLKTKKNNVDHLSF